MGTISVDVEITIKTRIRVPYDLDSFNISDLHEKGKNAPRQVLSDLGLASIAHLERNYWVSNVSFEEVGDSYVSDEVK